MGVTRGGKGRRIKVGKCGKKGKKDSITALCQTRERGGGGKGKQVQVSLLAKFEFKESVGLVLSGN